MAIAMVATDESDLILFTNPPGASAALPGVTATTLPTKLPNPVEEIDAAEITGLKDTSQKLDGS
jgi:hypothetical protein